MKARSFICAWLVACADPIAPPPPDEPPPPPPWSPVVLEAPTPPAPIEAEPAQPAPPALTPCPFGWRTVISPGTVEVERCEPWPDGGRRTCPPAEEHFPGEPGCTPIGATCPLGQWPEDLPLDRPVLYVRAGADGTAADGSPASPFSRIGLAVAAAIPGTVIAIAAGTYDESFVIATDLTLAGACAERTVIAPSATSFGAAAIEVAGAQVELRDLQIGGQTIGIGALIDAHLQLRGVLIDGAKEAGLFVGEGSRVSGSKVVVRGTRSVFDGGFGQGIAVRDGGRLELERSAITGNEGFGVIAAFGAGVILRDASVLDTESNGDRDGHGIAVLEGASLELERVAVERNRDTGVFVEGARSVVRASDLVIRSTLGRRSDGAFGAGIGAQEGGRLELQRTAILGNRAAGLYLNDAATSAELEDCLIAETIDDGDAGEDVRGVSVSTGAHATLRRVLLSRNQGLGIDVGIAPATAELEDVIVADMVLEEPRAFYGMALGVYAGGVLRGARVLVANAIEAGLSVVHPGSRAELFDLRIRGVRGSAPQALGRGVHVEDRASVELFRAEIEDSAELGANVVAGATLRLEDGTIRSREGVALSTEGYGLLAFSGSRVELRRVVFDRNFSLGLGVADAGTVLSAEDLVVRDTGEDPRYPGLNLGMGLAVEYGGRAELRRAIFERNHLSGINIWEPGSLLSAEDLVVRDTRSRSTDGVFGRGISVHDGGRFEVRRALVQATREAAIAASGPGTSVQLTDVAVEDTLPRACSAGACAGFGSGVGLLATDGGAIDARRFRVARGAQCGAQIAYGSTKRSEPSSVAGSIELHDGEVIDNPIGVNIQSADFDARRLSDNVRFDGNGIDLDAQVLPVPSSSVATPSIED